MVRSIPLLGLLLAACGNEPDFDQRFAEAERRIEGKAAAIERDLKAPDQPPETSDK